MRPGPTFGPGALSARVSEGRSAVRGRPDVLVEVEQVGRVVAALDVGQALVRAGRIGGPDPLLALDLEEVRVDPDVVRGELVVERLGPGDLRGFGRGILV